MDFAVYLGGERTVIYKRGQGIVLNEPTVVAYKEIIETSERKAKRTKKLRPTTKVIAVGKEAMKLAGHEDVFVVTPFLDGRITDTMLAGALFTDLFKKVSGGSVAVKRRCLICIPSSLTASELNDYKTAVYVAGVAEAKFIPAVVASAFNKGYDFRSEFVALSIIVEGGGADIAVIQNGEIIAGGTVEDVSKLEDAKKQILHTLDGVEEYDDLGLGDRISVITGAGWLLEKDLLIKKLIRMN